MFRPSPYDMLFIPAATYHYLIPTESVPYENYVIGIDPKILDTEGYNKLFSSPLMISIKDDPEVKGFFSRLDFYDKNYSDADFNSGALHLIHELVTYLRYRKDDLHFVHSGSLEHIDEIIKYISDNIENQIDADSIAEHFSLSKSYVQNLFSQNMHIGIKKYIMQKKIYAADNDLSLGIAPYKVCEKYGFGDYSIFYRLYRRTFGYSPKSRK